MHNGNAKTRFYSYPITHGTIPSKTGKTRAKRLKTSKTIVLTMTLSLEAELLAWLLGLIGAVFGIASIFFSYSAYQNMQGGKLGHAMRKLTVGTAFVIFGMLHLGLTSAAIVPRNDLTVPISGAMAFLSGIFLLLGYRELNYLTKP